MTVLRVKPRLHMEVEGLGRFQVAIFSADWSLNQIPNATCVMAVGRQATNGRTAARVHFQIGKVKKMMKAKVFVELEGQFDKDNAWPSGERVCFEGRVTGVVLTKVRGKVSFVISMTHWLQDLNFSSSLSQTSHPNNPLQLTFGAAVGSFIRGDRDAGAMPSPYGMSATAEIESVTLLNIQDDLWGLALKPYLCGLAKAEHIEISTALKEGCGIAAGKNDQALEALKRIEGASGDDCNLDYSCYTPPLSLNAGAAVPLEVAQAILRAIAAESMESFAGSTLWAKLAGSYSSSYMFSIVPLVERALVVPFIPGLRSLYCKKIWADDYDPIRISGTLQRPIRAVAVPGERLLRADAASSAKAPEGIGGCFAPEDADTDGQILFVRPPSWLQNVPSTGFSVLESVGLKAKTGSSSSTTPRDISAVIKGTKDGKTKEDLNRDTLEMYNGWAHAIYAWESLRGRRGVITGKLRFDIAPGATVGIEGVPERHLPSSDQLGQSIVASVLRVSTSIDAEAPRAATAFLLEHARTLEENKDDKTSLLQHPLYTTEFTGAPLIDDYQFGGEDCC